MMVDDQKLFKGLSGTPEELERLLQFHLNFLKEDLLPWWMKHALDERCGGLFSCIKDDGSIVSKNKYIWSQVRALWTFSAAYNRIEKDPQWLAAANTIWRFVENHGQTHSGRWMFLTDQKGNELEGPTSIQCDAFAIMGLVEYAKATKNKKAIEKARLTAQAVIDNLSKPGSYTTEPYPLPEGMKTHKVAMQFSLAFKELALLTDDDSLHIASEALTQDVLEVFWSPTDKAVVEYKWLDGSDVDQSIGRYCSPGHGYETAWYQLENLRNSNHSKWKSIACDIIRDCFELGWDKKFGGLFLGVDVKGKDIFFENSENKIWWPFTEAFCALLMAYEETNDEAYLKDYQKIHNWAFRHFSCKDGEWIQKLNRSGEPIGTVVALPVKDPFHLPRAIIYCIETLRRIKENTL